MDTDADARCPVWTGKETGDSLIVFGGEAGKRRSGAMVLESNEEGVSEDGADDVAEGDADSQNVDDDAEEPEVKSKTGLQIRMSKKQS